MKRFSRDKLVLAIVAILVQIVSTHVQLELTPGQIGLIRDNISKEILVFALAYVASSDLASSLIVAVTFYVIFGVLLNEESRWCLIPKQLEEYAKRDKTNRILRQLGTKYPN